jgi:AcrR family transcriptional regulator
MNWSSDGDGQGRRGYHHGNLREALVSAALDLLARRGPGGFTFAEAARAAGVSPAAPYRHFRDRDDLLAEVARRGFERFEAELARAWNDGAPDLLTAFERVGRAYLAFARREPAYYAAMFEAGLPQDTSVELAQAGERAFAVIRHAAEALCAELPKTRRPPALMVALHVWAMSHGIASLFARGDGARRTLPMPPEDLLEAGVLVYLQGLGLAGGRAADEKK